MRAGDQGEEFKMPTIVGALIFLVPIALLAGYGSKLAASRLSARCVWLKILVETIMLAVCLFAFIAALQFYQGGHDELGLSMILVTLAGLGVLVCGGAIVGNLVGMQPRP
jgi:hypothetical protein